jgi:hypothetical protein
VAEFVEANFFADVELNQNQDGAAEWGAGRLGRDQSGQGFYGNFADGWRAG